jgi:hypothetical protein
MAETDSKIDGRTKLAKRLKAEVANWTADQKKALAKQVRQSAQEAFNEPGTGIAAQMGRISSGSADRLGSRSKAGAGSTLLAAARAASSSLV